MIRIRIKEDITTNTEICKDHFDLNNLKEMDYFLVTCRLLKLIHKKKNKYLKTPIIRKNIEAVIKNLPEMSKTRCFQLMNLQ